MTKRKDFVVEEAKKHNKHIADNVAEYISAVKDQYGRGLSRNDLKSLVIRVIAFASFTAQDITIKLVNEVMDDNNREVSASRAKRKDDDDPYEEDEEYVEEQTAYRWLFNPRSHLENEAFEHYEKKYGHIPVTSLSEEAVKEHKEYFFEVLEHLKMERIKKA